MEKLRMLVADDSRVELECVQHLVRKYGFPLELRCAVNGREALDTLSQEPFDLLLTDIKMPFMDGLALSKEALAMFPDLKIIIFSGFNEFEYAKTAMGLGVQDYLLKPIDPEEFERSMERILRRTREQQAQRAQSRSNAQYARQFLLHRIIHGADPAETPGVPKKALDFLGGYGHLALLELDKNFFRDPSMDYDQYFASRLPLRFEALHISQTQHLFLLEKDAAGAPLERQALAQAAADLCGAIGQDFGIGCHIALSAPLGPGDSLAQVYHALETLVEKRFFFPHQPVLFNDPEAEDTAPLALSFLDQVERDIQERSLSVLKVHLEQFFELLQSSVVFSQHEALLFFADLLSELSTLFPPERRPSIAERIAEIASVQDITALIEMVRGVLDALEPQELASGGASRSELVKQYIHSHYDRDLSLEELAKAVYVHPHYLCRMFKKETGENLNKYIKAFRMEKARQLLRETPMKVSAICKAVGYQNLSYFCQNFREFYGTSPERFRKGTEGV